MSYQNFVQPLKHFTEVAYSAELGVWNAVTSTDGEVMKSTDGLSWTNCTLPSITDAVITQIQYGRKFDGTPIFMIQSGNQPAHVKTWLTSTDGITYTVASTGLGSSRLFYANGWFYNFLNNKSYRSLDGINWETLGNVPNLNWASAAYGFNILLVLGQPSDNTFAMSTDNGWNWTTVTTPFQASDVVFDGTKFVACSASESKIAVSGYGTSWTVVNTSVSIEKMSVYYGNIIGIKSGTSVVLTSIDHGTTWATNAVTNSAPYSAVSTKQGFNIPVLFPTPLPTAATPTPTTTPSPTPTPTVAPAGILVTAVNNINTTSLAPTSNGYTLQNDPVIGQAISTTFTQSSASPEYVNINLTNNSSETITININGVIYTVLPGQSFNQTTLLNPGDTVGISGPVGNYPAGSVTGGIAVVPAPTPTPTSSPTPTPTNTASPTPTPTTTASPTPTPSPTLMPSKLWMWGNNNAGLMGINRSSGFASYPVQTISTNVTNFTACINNPSSIMMGFITNDGRLWVWGANTNGNLGDGTTTDRSSPIQTLAGGTDWSNIDASDTHAIAVKTDGSLWAWGNNAYGQLGTNDIVDRNSPVKIGNGTTWSKCAAGNKFSMALKTDGTLWAAGYNYSATLGLGNNVDKSSFTQLLINGTGYTDIKCGLVHTAAKKSNNTLWLWGDNSVGQLGLNIGNSPITTPTQEVTGSTNWGEFAPMAWGMIAIKGGHAFTWGQDTQGCLGQNTRNVDLSYPTQIIGSDGTATNCAGGYDTIYIRKSNSTIWGAGTRDNYELDNGINAPSVSSIIQVAVSKNWENIFAIANSTIGKEA
jgi:alpha-tubulin suppressor-like RCC1 family protein